MRSKIKLFSNILWLPSYKILFQFFSPDCLIEEYREEGNAHAAARLDDDLHELSASLEVLAQHEGRRLSS